jgi:hypothetical protein
MGTLCWFSKQIYQWMVAHGGAGFCYGLSPFELAFCGCFMSNFMRVPVALI